METIEWIKIIIICLSSYFIAAFVHELGHVITGLINGWKLQLLVVGPIGIKGKPNGGIKIYFEKNLRFWGGVGGTLPKDEDEKNIAIWAKILLGGPIASIILGLITIPTGIYLNNIFLGILGAMGIGMGIATILPYPIKTGTGTYIDGYRWKRLKNKSSDTAYNEEVALWKFVEFEQLNKNYQTFDPMHFKILKLSDYSVTKLFGLYAEYKYHHIRGENERLSMLKDEMDTLKSAVPKFIFEDLKSELQEIDKSAENNLR